MTLNEIKGLIKEFDESGLSFLELECKETKIKLKKKISMSGKNKEIQNQAVNNNPVMETSTLQPVSETKVTDKLVAIKAPLVGVFYEKPNPEARPFVTAGQKVSKGDVVCLIEAMKMINEVTSPVNGTVKKIAVNNEALVSFQEVLMEIEEQ